MEKASRLLGFRPGRSALSTTLEAIAWLVDNGKIKVA
jgi:hypothetical protein